MSLRILTKSHASQVYMTREMTIDVDAKTRKCLREGEQFVCHGCLRMALDASKDFRFEVSDVFLLKHLVEHVRANELPESAIPFAREIAGFIERPAVKPMEPAVPEPIVAVVSSEPIEKPSGLTPILAVSAPVLEEKPTEPSLNKRKRPSRRAKP